MSKLAFTNEDRLSGTWAKIKARLEQRLASQRAKNDGDLTETQTQRLRGSIQEIKYLLAMGDVKPSTPEPEFPD